MRTVLKRVCGAMDRLIAAAEPFDGLFPSLLDRRTGAMLRELPTPIEGQRNGDRAPLGSNLMHDEPTLATLYGLAAALGRPDYAAAADRCLRRFATHCTDTATGLFPWGEHSFWNLVEDRVGNSYVEAAGRNCWTTHDHLRQAPLWLWEKLAAFNPHCVERFAEGLDFHWTEGKREEYIRHAQIEKRVYPGRGTQSCDFPRHSGFYMFDWAFAWKLTRRDDFILQILQILEHWWTKRDARNLLLIESRCPPGHEIKFHNVNAPAQTLSLAASMLESAILLEAGQAELAATLRERAAAYIEGFLAAPHDLRAGRFALGARLEDNALVNLTPVWASRYGHWPTSYVALVCLCLYRLTRDERLLRCAEAAGRAYLDEPFPSAAAVPGMDGGLGLGLQADLYELTGENRWRDGGIELAEQLTPLYLDEPLPRGAAGIDWYESQMGPGFLLHGLARVALLAESREHCPLTPDYTAR